MEISLKFHRAIACLWFLLNENSKSMTQETIVTQSKQPWGNRWLAWILAMLVGVGVVLRFSHLEAKVYWGDEVFTSFRIAGYTLAEVNRELLDERPRTVAELQATYQQPHEQRSMNDTIRSLAEDDPQHPPFFYIFARIWEQILGSELGTKRAFAALCSLLLIPASAGIAVELFGSQLAGWIAAAMVSLSPFHLLYAQEMREYGLWAAMIALTGWLLLRALRTGGVWAWVGWSLSLTLLLYTHLFSVLIAGGYCLVAAYWLWRSSQSVSADQSTLTRSSSAANQSAITEQAASANAPPVLLSRQWQFFGISTLSAGILFLPWIIATLQNLSTISRTNGFTAQAVPLSTLLYNWWLNLARPFADWEPTGQILSNPIAARGIVLGIAILVAISFWNLAYRQPLLSRLLLWAMMGSQGLALVILDLSQGGFRSAIIRYLAPCYLGLQLTITGYLSTLLLPNTIPDRPAQQAHHSSKFLFIKQNIDQNIHYIHRRLIAYGLLATLLIAGGSSCAMILPANTWWNKQGSYAIPPLAQVIERYESPWIVAYDTMPRMFSLSYHLNSRVVMQFIHAQSPVNVPPNYDLLLFRSSLEVRDRLRRSGWQFDRQFQTSTIYPYLSPLDKQAQLWLDSAQRNSLLP